MRGGGSDVAVGEGIDGSDVAVGEGIGDPRERFDVDDDPPDASSFARFWPIATFMVQDG